MIKINVGGTPVEVAFTTYTAKVMYELTGINLYNLDAVANIFGDDHTATPENFEKFGKLLYAAMAAGSMPPDADEHWKPAFSVNSVLNRIHINDSGLIGELTAAYLNIPYEEFKKRAEEETGKNELAPTSTGPAQ